MERRNDDMFVVSRDSYQVLLEGLMVESHRPIFASVLEGTFTGRVHGDDPTQPRSSLIATEVGFYLVMGDPGNEPFVEGLPGLFHDTILPATEDKTIVLLMESPEWLAVLDAVLLPKFFIKETRNSYGLDAAAYRKDVGDARLVSEGYRIVSGERDGFPCMRAYDSQGEAGYAACVISQGEGEMDVFTGGTHRRKGLSTTLSRMLIDNLLTKGIRPVWTCWRQNEASIGLAGKLGFVKNGDTDLYVWVPEFDK